MKRTYLVAKRELLENVRTKGFWLGILMMPLVLALTIAIPLIVNSAKEAQTFTIVDHSGFMRPAIERSIAISDLRSVFKTGFLPKDWDKSPRILKRIREHADDLSERQLTSLAAAVLDGTVRSTSGFPTRLQEQLHLHGDELSYWWNSLSLSSKKTLSPSLSAHRFLYQPMNESTTDTLNQAISDGEIFAYIDIGEDPVKNPDSFRYVSNNLTDRDLLAWLTGHITRIVENERMSEKQIDPEIAAWINTPVTFNSVQISSDGKEEAVKTEDIVTQWAPVALVYLLWIAVMVNTQLLLTNTVEEKSNKLIEVLLSSIDPLTLMSGKVLGIASTGICMIICWGLILLLPLLIFGDADILATLPFDLMAIVSEPVYFGSFLVYFILGFLFYAAILVGLGSVCNSLKDAQNLTLPVQMIQIVPLLIMIPIGKNPDGTLAQVMSWIPPFTPFVMMNRAAAPPSGMEYLGTTLLMLISVAAALWFATRIFRVGILLSGSRPGIAEMLRWLRTPYRRERKSYTGSGRP